jgi:hypothetical protein
MYVGSTNIDAQVCKFVRKFCWSNSNEECLSQSERSVHKKLMAVEVSEILSVSGLAQTIIMCALAMVNFPCAKKLWLFYLRPWHWINLNFLSDLFGYTTVKETNKQTKNDPQKVKAGLRSKQVSTA